MELLTVTLIYESNDGDSVSPYVYTLSKTFMFKKLPAIECGILVPEDRIKEIIFNNVSYDPHKDKYYVVNRIDENVGFSNHNRFVPLDDRPLIMGKVIQEYRRTGWKLIKKREPTYYKTNSEWLQTID